MTDEQKDMLLSLQKTIADIAYHLILTHWFGIDARDIIQEMNLFLAETFVADPTYMFQHKPNYMTRAAMWHAQHWLTHTYTRKLNKQKIRRFESLDSKDREGKPIEEWYEEYEFYEPDIDLIIDVRDALSQLDDFSFQVAQLRAAGWKARECPAKLGVKRNIYQKHMHRVKVVLTPLWETMHSIE